MKILIADDHALFREGLRHVLDDLAQPLLVLEALDCPNALQLAGEHPDLDLVLLDLQMPGEDGFTALAYFASHLPATPVVILSASDKRSDMQRSLDMGAMGFIPKNTPGSVMLSALNLVLSGGIYIPPSMIKDEYRPHSNSGQKSTTGLTPRQLEVLALLVEGGANKEIARELNLAEATVKMHVTAILKCLDVNNRTKAARAAEQAGIRLSEINS
ncbi:MAG: response regulator [Thiohalomonadales bacterium]